MKPITMIGVTFAHGSHGLYLPMPWPKAKIYAYTENVTKAAEPAIPWLAVWRLKFYYRQ